ncbi:hypothetical protein Y032_0014g2255 [Ancylostoma ceylanicum]|uniref:Uncharacterized protein n=1 Tax=Ancylostoma ceylanicum TaxID=53326 RepID=A0A016VAF6_9BILA|nr:hypothetical protein Y032_0014g2255 [Ancylostoma ceylanicum]
MLLPTLTPSQSHNSALVTLDLVDTVVALLLYYLFLTLHWKKFLQQFLDGHGPVRHEDSTKRGGGHTLSITCWIVF